ncbi:putative alt1-alanine aminotransferase [Meira miltonrushii]|uniref:Glutamate pyruvate transaminase n=1 Tax=Meira miltonrushii TaxID=1280837 RepID=A0A316VGH8_9BASI|nr:putative alt1-alanine aminotransferase [Meira miltonrushii]PWN36747.1 putative alt1-alanine aminotransferase [Meira miltonrushii]
MTPTHMQKAKAVLHSSSLPFTSGAHSSVILRQAATFPSSSRSVSYKNSNSLTRQSRSSPSNIGQPWSSSSTITKRTFMTSSSSSYKKVLTLDSINQNVRNVEYAVRGEISNRANAYSNQLAEKKGKLPFDSVVSANIGNPQQQPHLAQKPLTFWRQVAALTEYPDLIESQEANKLFPQDAKDRAKHILEDVGSVGAYSHSKGAQSIRKHVAQFIEERDGYPSDPEMIYLTAGASAGVQLLLSVLISSSKVGIMIPIPQYPLYSAALSYYDAQPVKYFLNSDDDWSVDVKQMAKEVDDARAKGTDVRALVVINPGNPTGSCLSEENVRQIIQLAHEKSLIVMADEVYQTNIFKPKDLPFVSFKKVLRDFSKSTKKEEQSIADEVELVSFHSISKGVSGECGRRGGYFELTNISTDVEAQIYKMASVNLCPSIQGQIGVDLLVRPPKKGEESFELYQKEVDSIHQTLLERSRKMADKFNQLEGIQCGEAQGALYLFPSIKLPQKAMEKAKEEKRKPDEYYCLRLLDATGICVVPGGGFGKVAKEDGTIFLRTTILAKETDAFVDRFGKFHQEFLEEFGKP